MSNEIKQKITFILFAILLIGCITTRTYIDNCAPIRTDNVLSIRIEVRSLENKNFTITDSQQIKNFIEDINNAKVNGPWKGANWDKILLCRDDDTIAFNTNGKVFGLNNSGTFYNLNKKYKYFWK